MEDFPGYDGRPVAVDDAALLLPMYEAHDLATVGTVDITLADVDMLVRDPRADLGRSLLLTRDGVAAGVLVPVRQSGSDRAGAVDLEIVAHPDHAALYAGLVDRAVAGLPPDARGDVWAMGPAEKEALRARGFRSTASHVRLHRDLAGDEQEPPARDAARVRLVESEEDRRTFHATVAAVFSDGNESAVDPYDVWSARMDSSEVHDPSQWWLLEQRTAAGTWQAVGLVQGNRQDAEAGGAWIKNYGLVPEARGSGLGGWLLRWAVARFAALGYTRVGLGADLANATAALAVYAKAGFRELYTAERFSLEPAPARD